MLYRKKLNDSIWGTFVSPDLPLPHICIIYCAPSYTYKKMSQLGQNFFQRQEFFSLLCGMHSINNLLGTAAYNKRQMNQICYQLSGDLINPHKHIFGGDYDANVLLIALQNYQFTTKWHDRRKDFVIRELINEEGHDLQLVGYIINKHLGGGIFNKIFRLSPRHWIAMRREGGNYKYLDSNENSPRTFTRAQAQQRIVQMLKVNNEPDQSTQVIEVYKAK